MTASMLRLCLAICLFFSTTLPVFSQDTAPEQTEKKAPFYLHYVQDLSTKLSLSADQTEKITAILRESHNKMIALSQDTKSTLPFQEKKALYTPIKDETEARILKLLSPEQATQYTAFKAEKKKHFKTLMQAHFLKKLDQTLTLTEDQQNHIKAITAHYAEKGPLTQEIKAQIHSDIEALLTPEQKERFATFKIEHKHTQKKL